MPVDLVGMTAEQVIGSTVVNADEATLGGVDDAVLGADGKIESLVISFGGFLASELIPTAFPSDSGGIPELAEL